MLEFSWAWNTESIPFRGYRIALALVHPATSRRFALLGVRGRLARIISTSSRLTEALPVMIFPLRGEGRAPARFAALGCILFGLIHILNVHPIGDGLWFWYAKLFREGHRLYRDMHLNLPPFFVLVTAINQSVFGISWLASKIPAVLQLLTYVAGLYLVSLYAPVRPWPRAFLVSAAFFLDIAISFARFDDYHVPTYIAIVISAWLLLIYRSQERLRSEWLLAALLGVLSGISLANRLNDGASLFAAVCVVLPLFLRRHRIAASAVFIAASFLCLLLLVLSTGDTVRGWANDSIFRAAAIKGGTGSILLSPLLYPFRQALALAQNRYQLALVAFFSIVTAIVAAVVRSREMIGTWRNLRTATGMLLLLALFAGAGRWLGLNFLTIVVGALAMVTGTVLMVVLAGRSARQIAREGVAHFDPLPLLLLLPFAQALGAAMTAAKALPEVTPAIGLMLVMLPISVPAVRAGLPELVLASAAFVLTIYGVAMKALNPYQWQSYWNGPVFAGREWYQHAKYGPMYIEKSQLQLATALCAPIQRSGTMPELLSLPNAYPNYFCGIEPWHGYVQTWYDTSSASTISGLVSDLQQKPPEWIAYERSLDMIALHERSYGKAPLPHRELDAMISDKLRSGVWSIALQQCFGGSNWLLIHTRALQDGEVGDVLVPSQDTLSLCARTKHDVRLP